MGNLASAVDELLAVDPRDVPSVALGCGDRGALPAGVTAAGSHPGPGRSLRPDWWRESHPASDNSGVVAGDDPVVTERLLPRRAPGPRSERRAAGDPGGVARRRDQPDP